MELQTFDQTEPLSPSSDLITRINSSDRAIRREAESQVLDGRAANTELLVEILERENKKKSLRFGVITGTIVVILVGLMIALRTIGGKNNPMGFGYPMYMLAVAIGAYFAPTRLQKRAARALAATDDVRAVPPLIDTLDKQDGVTKKASQVALARLLPQLTAPDAEEISTEKMGKLKQALDGDNRDLALAIVKAAEHIGDEEFVKPIEALAEGKGKAKKDTELQKTAQEVLPAVKELAERDHLAKTLLRPAMSETHDSSELLRPAANGPVELDLLVRPSDKPKIEI